jgi:hypothetical protein
MDKAVRKVINEDKVTMNKVGIKPTFPITHPKRRYMITPRIVRILGVNTPLKVPN